MEIAAWKKRRLIPEWGGNRDQAEPCAIIFHPPSVGWMAKWRELAMAAPTLDPDQFVERSGEEGFAESVGEWTDLCQKFRVEIMTELVVGVENLTEGGKDVDLSDALAFVMENELLREEIFNAILAEGTLTTSEGKD